MINSFRSSLSAATVAMTPFLLTACGDDGQNGQTKFEIVVLALLLCTISVAHSWLRKSPGVQEFKS